MPSKIRLLWTTILIVYVLISSSVVGQSGGMDLINLFVDLAGIPREDCRFTECSSSSSLKCAWGMDELFKTRGDCPGFKEKKFCCKPGHHPVCFHTPCSKASSCPGTYREIYRGRDGCRGFDEMAYCCRHGVPCVDIPCSKTFFNERSCPAEYEETKRTKVGCPGTQERLTCCLPRTGGGGGESYGHSSGIESSPGNVNTQTITETKTIPLEDGGTRTVTVTKSVSCSGPFCGGGNSLSVNFALFSSATLILMLSAML